MAAMLFVKPEAILQASSFGAENALSLAKTLLIIYPFWLGMFKLMSDSRLTDKLAKLLKKPIRFVFGKTDEISEKYITLNVAANIIGLGGIATPMGIEACCSLEKSNNDFAKTTLLVLAATSLQLLPLSVVSLRENCGSAAAFDIVLPSILSTLVSTVLGVLLVKIFVKK